MLPTLINYQEIETFLHETRVREIDEQNIPDLSTMFGMLAVDKRKSYMSDISKPKTSSTH